jgi:hypothetical protein
MVNRTHLEFSKKLSIGLPDDPAPAHANAPGSVIAWLRALVTGRFDATQDSSDIVAQTMANTSAETNVLLTCILTELRVISALLAEGLNTPTTPENYRADLDNAATRSVQ